MLELLHAHDISKGGHHHKDKLAETKKQEAAIHEALKAQQQQAKQVKEQKHQDEARQLKAERAYSLEADPDKKPSKRAVKEQRELLKHAAKAATSTMCEHGVQRCRICFPHRSEADKHIEHERKRSDDGEADE